MNNMTNFQFISIIKAIIQIIDDNIDDEAVKSTVIAKIKALIDND